MTGAEDAAPRLRITVNGAPREAPSGATVADLLLWSGLRPGVPAAVERNGLVVPRAEHGTSALRDGDRVEIVTLAGGG